MEPRVGRWKGFYHQAALRESQRAFDSRPSPCSSMVKFVAGLIQQVNHQYKHTNSKQRILPPKEEYGADTYRTEHIFPTLFPEIHKLIATTLLNFANGTQKDRKQRLRLHPSLSSKSRYTMLTMSTSPFSSTRHYTLRQIRPQPFTFQRPRL